MFLLNSNSRWQRRQRLAWSEAQWVSSPASPFSVGLRLSTTSWGFNCFQFSKFPTIVSVEFNGPSLGSSCLSGFPRPRWSLRLRKDLRTISWQRHRDSLLEKILARFWRPNEIILLFNVLCYMWYICHICVCYPARALRTLGLLTKIGVVRKKSDFWTKNQNFGPKKKRPTFYY